MASHKAIIAYWSQRKDEGELSVDWADAHTHCWRCGSKGKLTHCHIIPDSRGGTDEPSNLVLLCHLCHLEAPNVADPRFMWIWLHAYKANCYGDFWYDRAKEEFERMFKRKPFSKMDVVSISDAERENIVKELLKKAIVHFGESRLNPSTLASLVYLIEEQLLRDTKTFDFRLIQTKLPFTEITDSNS